MTPRLLEFEGDFDVKANVRPIYPIAVRIDSFKTVKPVVVELSARDVARTAEIRPRAER